jgi:hypothetical protein
MEKHGVEEDPKCAARLAAPLGPEPYQDHVAFTESDGLSRVTR